MGELYLLSQGAYAVLIEVVCRGATSTLPALACTTSVPPSCVRLVSASISACGRPAASELGEACGATRCKLLSEAYVRTVMSTSYDGWCNASRITPNRVWGAFQSAPSQNK